MHVRKPGLGRLAERRRRILIRRLIVILVCITAFLGGIITFLRLPVLAIKNIEIQGINVLDETELKTSIENVLQSNFAGVFSRKNFLIYPRQLIKKTLFTHFQRIEQISLEIQENNILIVKIKERQSKYLWCGLNPALSEECFFSDSRGYIFDQAPYFSGNAYFRIYGLPAQAGLRHTSLAVSYIGLPISSPEEFTQLMEFRQKLETLKFTPTYLWFKEEGECVVHDSLGFEIFFLCSGNLEETAENLRVAFQAEPFIPDYEQRLPDLLYLDLRHDNKVFFKFE